MVSATPIASLLPAPGSLPACARGPVPAPSSPGPFPAAGVRGNRGERDNFGEATLRASSDPGPGWSRGTSGEGGVLSRPASCLAGSVRPQRGLSRAQTVALGYASGDLGRFPEGLLSML